MKYLGKSLPSMIYALKRLKVSVFADFHLSNLPNCPYSFHCMGIIFVGGMLIYSSVGAFIFG